MSKTAAGKTKYGGGAGTMSKTGKVNFGHYEDTSYEHQIHQEVL